MGVAKVSLLRIDNICVLRKECCCMNPEQNEQPREISSEVSAPSLEEKAETVEQKAPRMRMSW
jgi:hypothetical protein